MKLVGLTGGIASGKSTVSRVIREAGVPVVDADEAVHRLEEVGERGWRALYELLGFSVLLADGSLDRVRLARRLFSQSETRRNVNRVLHPLVRQELWREVRELEDTGHRVVVLDIPLLFENGLHHLVDEVWVVWASPEQQLERLRRSVTVLSLGQPRTTAVRLQSLPLCNAPTSASSATLMASSQSNQRTIWLSPGG